MIYYVSVDSSMSDVNGYFVGAVISTDDIILLGPTHSIIISFLNVCDVHYYWSWTVKLRNVVQFPMQSIKLCDLTQ